MGMADCAAMQLAVQEMVPARVTLVSNQARHASARLLMEPVIQLHKAHKAHKAMARIKYASVVFSSNPAFSCASWSLFSKTGLPGRNWARLKESAVRNELLSLSGHGAFHAGHATELPREFGHLQAILVFESGVKDMPAWVCQVQSISRESRGRSGAVETGLGWPAFACADDRAFLYQGLMW